MSVLFYSIPFYSFILLHSGLSFSILFHSMLFYPNPSHSTPLNLCFYILVCHFLSFSILFHSILVCYNFPFHSIQFFFYILYDIS